MNLLISETYLENRVENWQSQMDLPSFTGGHSANHVSSIIYGLFAVESSLLSGKALADNFSGFRQFHIISSGRIGAPPGPNSRLAYIGWKCYILWLISKARDPHNKTLDINFIISLILPKKGDRILAEAAMFVTFPRILMVNSKIRQSSEISRNILIILHI